MKAAYSPTMSQIAKELGISVSTVSRVVNCREARISEATKAKVKELAAKLGYSPNFLASSLSRKQGSRTIGICVPLFNGFLAQAVDSVIASLGRSGYTGIVMPAREGGPSEQEVFRAFVERRVEGVILRPSSYEVDAGYFNELDARGLPIVMIDVELKNIKMPFCGTDDYTGGRLAAEHLLELGHRVLGHVAGSPQATTAIRRKQGFLDAVAACPGARAVVCPHESFDADDAAIEAFLAKERPSAVFAANDELASHVCKVAELFGLRIPSELSIIGFANLSFSKMLTPPLSSFDQRPELIAENAVELLFSLMEERKGGKPSDDSLGERRLVQPEPVLRASTSAFIPS